MVTTSAHNSPTTGELVADETERIGPEGVIPFEGAKAAETPLEVATSRPTSSPAPRSRLIAILLASSPHIPGDSNGSLPLSLRPRFRSNSCNNRCPKMRDNGNRSEPTRLFARPWPSPPSTLLTLPKDVGELVLVRGGMMPPYRTTADCHALAPPGTRVALCGRRGHPAGEGEGQVVTLQNENIAEAGDGSG